MNLVSDSDRAIIHELEEKGIVEPCKPGQALAENQKYRTFPVRYIRNVHWSITGRCNCKCRHCYIHAPENMHGELPHDVIMSFIPQFEECGIMRAELSGGEPLVRDDFLDIVASLTEHNIKVAQIYTNGLLVNEELLNELDRMNIRPEFVMSYDGAGWHDWMRGVHGAEEAVNRAFSLCRDKGFPMQAEMCMHRLNVHTLRESINHLASLGVYSVKVSGVMNAGEWKANNEEEKMPFIQERGLAECINNSYWIELVNLRLRSLFENNGECRECEFSDRCSGGCRATAMSYDPDNYFGKDPMTCELFKGRWIEKVIDKMKTIRPEAKSM